MRLFFLAASLLAVACTSATKTSAVDPCSNVPGDSIYTATKPAYRECSVSSRAVPILPMARPDYSPSSRSRSCTAAEFEYVINELGQIEDGSAHVLRSTDPLLTEAVLAVLPVWRFQPAKKDTVPVRQITRYKISVGTVSVLVPAGSGPPRSLPAGTRPPKC